MATQHSKSARKESTDVFNRPTKSTWYVFVPNVACIFADLISTHYKCEFFSFTFPATWSVANFYTCSDISILALQVAFEPFICQIIKYRNKRSKMLQALRSTCWSLFFLGPQRHLQIFAWANQVLRMLIKHSQMFDSFQLPHLFALCATKYATNWIYTHTDTRRKKKSLIPDECSEVVQHGTLSLEFGFNSIGEKERGAMRLNTDVIYKIKKRTGCTNSGCPNQIFTWCFLYNKMFRI